MEKITKEELLEKLGVHVLSDDELENVFGGYNDCEIPILDNFSACFDEGNSRDVCLARYCSDIASCGMRDIGFCGFDE